MAVMLTNDRRATTKECIDAARERLEQLRNDQTVLLRELPQVPAVPEDGYTAGDAIVADQRNRANRAGREFALAITALEDAAMRLNRGLTMAAGVYNEIDLEKPDGMERARANHEANVAANADRTPQRS